MATLQNIGKLKYRGKDGLWHPLPVVVQDAGGGVSTISGKGAPTSETQGKVNQLYRDEDTQRLYICTATDGGYTWAEVSGGTVGTVYIGKVKPIDGTLYWLDTSDSETESETVTYTVTKNLTNATIDNAAETVAEKSSYAATMTANEGYTLSSVTVTMSGVDITRSSYDAGNVYIVSVTGDIVITAVAVETAETVLYTITNNLVNVNTSNSAVSVERGASYTATLTVADGYDLDSVTVTMGGVDVTNDVYTGGVITIEAVTGDVVITATTVKQSEYNTAVAVVEVNLTGLNLYEDDGVTVINSGISSKRISSEAFGSDTEVEITLYMKNTSYGSMHVQSYDEENNKLYRRETFTKSDQYFESGKSYTYIYTIKAGCKLSFTVSNNNYSMFDITVMRKG